MAGRFRFEVACSNGRTLAGPLQCGRCGCRTRAGGACRRRTCRPFEKCREHLRTEDHLRIGRTTLAAPGGGRYAFDGLFAFVPRAVQRGRRARWGSLPAARRSHFEAIGRPRGLGGIEAFARAAFRKGDRIAEYVGEVLTTARLDRLYGSCTAPYALELRPGWVVDAAFRRGTASFVNHRSRGGGRVNCSYRREWDDDGRRVAGYAVLDIFHGDEIFADYGDDYRFDDCRHRTWRI